MASSWWDAQKMFDLYLLDYMVKRNMHETAAHFRAESNVPQAQVGIDTKEGFLREWWTILHDIMSSRERMSREAPPPPIFNLQTHQPTTQDGAKRMRIAQATFDMNQQSLPPFVTRQLPGGGSSLISANATPAAAGQMPIRTIYPLGYGRIFNEQQQPLNNVMPSPFGNMICNLPQAADIPLQRYLQKQPIQNPILHPFTANNGQGIRIGSSSNMLGNGSNGGTSLARGCPAVVTPDAGTSGEMVPMPPEGWLMNFLMDAQKFPPSYLSAKEQQKPPGQRSPPAEGSTAAGPGKSVDSIMGDLRDSDLDGNEEVSPWQKRIEGRFTKSFLYADGDENGNEEGIRLIEGHDEAQYLQATYDAVQEVHRLNTSKNKLLCCHFSSNGKLLATSGQETKVWIWKTDNSRYTKTYAGHLNPVTDIRFRPNTNVFATSSFDKTVQIWDAGKPSRSLYKLKGHGEQVLSLDFHPRQTDLLCSCDRDSEIRLWNVNQDCLVKVSKGATAQVRFQPQSGKLLALASGNTVSIVDSETYSIQFTLKEHVKDVRSICWDSTGKHIASVSEESARVWSLAAGGKCIQKLMSHGRDFHSCTFHPRVSQALLVGGHENLVFWSVNQKWSTEAHKGIIAAMASSQTTGLIASASHDGGVKLWK